MSPHRHAADRLPDAVIAPRSQLCGSQSSAQLRPPSHGSGSGSTAETLCGSGCSDESPEAPSKRRPSGAAEALATKEPNLRGITRNIPDATHQVLSVVEDNADASTLHSMSLPCPMPPLHFDEETPRPTTARTNPFMHSANMHAGDHRATSATQKRRCRAAGMPVPTDIPSPGVQARNPCILFPPLVCGGSSATHGASDGRSCSLGGDFFNGGCSAARGGEKVVLRNAQNIPRHTTCEEPVAAIQQRQEMPLGAGDCARSGRHLGGSNFDPSVRCGVAKGCPVRSPPTLQSLVPAQGGHGFLPPEPPFGPASRPRPVCSAVGAASPPSEDGWYLQ